MKREFIYWIIIGILIVAIGFLYLKKPQSNEIGRYQYFNAYGNYPAFLDTREGIVCLFWGGQLDKTNWTSWDLKDIAKSNKALHWTDFLK